MKRTNPSKLTDASKKQCTLTDFFLSRPTLPVNVTRSDREESEGEKPADPSAVCSVKLMIVFKKTMQKKKFCWVLNYL
jgi:hypothetical protein